MPACSRRERRPDELSVIDHGRLRRYFLERASHDAMGLKCSGRPERSVRNVGMAVLFV